MNHARLHNLRDITYLFKDERFTSASGTGDRLECQSGLNPFFEQLPCNGLPPTKIEAVLNNSNVNRKIAYTPLHGASFDAFGYIPSYIGVTRWDRRGRSSLTPARPKKAHPS